MNKVIISLIVASIIAAAHAVVTVARLEERFLSQKDQIILIRDDIKWMRDNWNKKK